jgi:hypothetical protein
VVSFYHSTDLKSSASLGWGAARFAVKSPGGHQRNRSTQHRPSPTAILTSGCFSHCGRTLEKDASSPSKTLAAVYFGAVGLFALFELLLMPTLLGLQ